MLKKLLREWLFADHGYVNNVRSTPELVRCTTDEELHTEDATHLYIFPATGGKVIEFRKYDRMKDKSHISRYIIKDGDDFADKLSKIITMENLKY